MKKRKKRKLKEAKVDVYLKGRIKLGKIKYLNVINTSNVIKIIISKNPINIIIVNYILKK
jgi:hypothetical protein